MFIHPQFDPVAVHLGPVSIRWYGLMYLLAFVMFVLLGRHRLRSYSSSTWTRRDLDDMVFLGVLGVVLGGRLGYVFFYKFSDYLTAPWRAFYVWEGGMSFHGGLLGTIVALVIYAKRRDFPISTVADLVTPTVPIGLGLGRIGNFINAELFGRPTDVDWCMVFPGAGPECRHPSQLYEAGLEGLGLFTLLWVVSRRPKPPGTLFWTFITGYGLCRMVVEFFREPDLHLGFILGPFSMGQVLSLPMVCVGAIMLARGYQRAAQAARPTG